MLSKRFFSISLSKTLTAQAIKKLSVIGAGQMGTGIAIVAAATGKIPNVQLLD